MRWELSVIGNWLLSRSVDCDLAVGCFRPNKTEQLKLALVVYSNPFACCYGPSASGEVKAAGAHLCQVFGQEPRDAVAQARLGVVEAWHQNYRSAARRLSKLPEKDSSSLDFLLALIPFNQRKRMAQVSHNAGNLDFNFS